MIRYISVFEACLSPWHLKFGWIWCQKCPVEFHSSTSRVPVSFMSFYCYQDELANDFYAVVCWMAFLQYTGGGEGFAAQRSVGAASGMLTHKEGTWGGIPTLEKSQWLSAKYGIDFKIPLMTHVVVPNPRTVYLSGLFICINTRQYLDLFHKKTYGLF